MEFGKNKRTRVYCNHLCNMKRCRTKLWLCGYVLTGPGSPMRPELQPTGTASPQEQAQLSPGGAQPMVLCRQEG